MTWGLPSLGFIGTSWELHGENSGTILGAIWRRAWEYFGATFGHTRTTSELLGDYQVTTVDLTCMNS